MKKTSAILGLILALSACSSDPNPPPVSLEQDSSPKIALDVRKISLADRSGSMPMNSPYKTNQFSPTISEAIKQWAIDHLQAQGQDGQAIILIKKASLVAQPMPLKDGIDSWFTRQQATKYVGRAEVSIETNGQGGFAVAEAAASRGVTLPEDPTEGEKQEAYMTLLNGMMKDLSKNLQSSIHGHMAKYIVPAGGAIMPSAGAVQQGANATVDSSANTSSMDGGELIAGAGPGVQGK
ncbi:MAG: hypothetical protein PHW76_00010 [Alphaproteobacteria bacterium]|nr:hypothetical protein [Alphaproteobacteria bacterium]